MIYYLFHENQNNKRDLSLIKTSSLPSSPSARLDLSVDLGFNYLSSLCTLWLLITQHAASPPFITSYIKQEKVNRGKFSRGSKRKFILKARACGGIKGGWWHFPSPMQQRREDGHVKALKIELKRLAMGVKDEARRGNNEKKSHSFPLSLFVVICDPRVFFLRVS